MNGKLKSRLLGLLWAVACLMPLAGCTGKPAAEPVATAPEAAQVVEAPAYAIVTMPLDSDPAALRAALALAPEAHVLHLEKIPRQLAEEGVKSPFFEYMAVVKFNDEAQLDAWVAQARQAVGDVGSVSRADLVVADGVSDETRPNAFFAVNLYETLVSAEAYAAYTKSYIVPNMASQKDSGVMTSYAMYLERADGSERPRSYLIKEYVGEDGFERSGPIKNAYKNDVLLKNAEWSRINDTKATIRSDLNETLAKNAGA